MAADAEQIRSVAITLKKRSTELYDTITPVYNAAQVWTLDNIDDDLPTVGQVKAQVEAYEAIRKNPLRQSPDVLEVKTGISEETEVSEIDYDTSFVGEIKYGFWTESPDASKWLLLDGSTIGNASSGAMCTGSAYQALFELLWTVLADTEAPVSGGRGATATDDFDSNKTLTLPDHRGRSPLGAGQGPGLSNRTLGETFGEEDHTTITDEMPSHSHTIPARYGSGDVNRVATSNSTGISNTPDTYSSGGGLPHNTVHPVLICQAIIRY